MNSEERVESLKFLAPVCLIGNVLKGQRFLQTLFLVNSHTGSHTAETAQDQTLQDEAPQPQNRSSNTLPNELIAATPTLV